jgi:hypothetical protein
MNFTFQEMQIYFTWTSYYTLSYIVSYVYRLYLLHTPLPPSSFHQLIHTYNEPRSDNLAFFSSFCFHTEMEFLDINLKTDSKLWLHAIHSPFYWRFYKKTILFFGFKNPYKKLRNKKSSSLFKNSIL